MQLPKKNPDVIFRRVSEGAVLLSTKDEVYFGLNEVGARIWELMTPGLAGMDALCAALSKEYEGVDADTIRADAVELIEELTQSGMLLGDETKEESVS